MSKGTTLYGRILRAVGAEALGQVLNVGIRLLLVPLFISTWGAATYGHWLTLTSLAAWIGLGDLGGQLYFVNRMTAAWASNEMEHFQELLSTGLFLFLASSILMFVIVASCITWLPISSWLDIQIIDSQIISIVLLLMALRFVIALPIGLLLGVFRATGAQATSVMYVNLMLVIQFVGSTIALMTKQGMLVLAGLEVVPVLVVAIIVLNVLRKRLPPEIKIWDFKYSSKKILKEAISPSFHFLGIQLSMAIIIQGCIIVIARALGPLEVVAFSAMRTVANVLSQLLAMLSHSAWPEFTKLHSTKQNEKLTFLFKTILLLSLMSGVTYLVILHNFGELLFNWWLKNKVTYQPLTMFLLSSFVILNTLWTFGGYLLMATNNHSEYARLQLPVNLLALIFFYFGAKHLGLPGSAGGLILGQTVLMVICVARLLKKYNWELNASHLLKLSGASLILLPMTLNLWTGLVVIVLVGLVLVKQLKNNKEYL